MITTGAISISQALMVNQTLLELTMMGNQIGDDGITAIASSLSNISITLLDVRDCGISVVGVRSLAEAISSNQNIRTLWLWNNPITVNGARLIMKAAVDSAVCENIWIDSKYDDDDEVKRMKKNILNDRRKQDVRSYFHNVANNFQMAQGTQCLHAIRNYMRKVMLKYQHVIGIITHYYSNLKSSRDNKSSLMM